MVAHYSPEPVAPAAPPPRRRLWERKHLWAGTGLLVGAFLGVATMIGVVAAIDDGEPLDIAIVLGSVVLEGLIGGIVLLMMRVQRVSFADLGFVRPRRWTPAIWAFVGSYLILIAYGVVLVLIDSLGGDVSAFDNGNQAPIGEVSYWLLVPLGLAVVVMAPLSEEMFFRGFLFGGLRERWRPLTAIAVTGLLFGIFHLNLSVIVPFTFIGALFAWAKETSGSIWPSMAAHAAINTISFVVLVATEL